MRSWNKLLVLLLSVPALAEPLNFADQDKQLHFTVSYSVNTTLIAATHRRWAAAGLTTAVGVAKEMSDKRFSSADLGADLAGIAASSLCSFVFEF